MMSAQLTLTEARRLIIWKWVYCLGSAGFTVPEAKRLVFTRYRLNRDGRLAHRTYTVGE